MTSNFPNVDPSDPMNVTKSVDDKVYIQAEKVFIQVVNEDKEDNGYGILDSGATVHLCGNFKVFKNIRECSVRIKCANNEFMTSSQKGDIDIFIEGVQFTLMDVLYVKNSPMLISIAKLVEDGDFEARFKFNYCKILNSKGIEVIEILRKPKDPTKKLYILPFVFKCNVHDKIMFSKTSKENCNHAQVY